MGGLVEFLKRVYPEMHKELSQPSTPLLWTHANDVTTTTRTILKHEKSIPFSRYSLMKGKNIISTWISTGFLIGIGSIEREHGLYCEHATEHVLVVSEAMVSDPLTIPVRACVTKLYSNPSLRDVLIAGTILGDVYIWKLTRQSGGRYTYTETHYPGEAMVTTFNVIKSTGHHQQSILISGQIDGKITTWIYDKLQDQVAPGHVYRIDESELPVYHIAPLSDASLCVQHGNTLKILNLNSYTTVAKKYNTRMLTAGIVCRGVDPLLEITQLKCVSEDLVIVTGKQGDFLSIKLINGVPETALTLYRTHHTNITRSIYVHQHFSAICLTVDGTLELYDIATGTKTSFNTEMIFKTTDLSVDEERLLCLTDHGSIEMFSILAG